MILILLVERFCLRNRNRLFSNYSNFASLLSKVINSLIMELFRLRKRYLPSNSIFVYVPFEWFIAFWFLFSLLSHQPSNVFLITLQLKYFLILNWYMLWRTFCCPCFINLWKSSKSLVWQISRSRNCWEASWRRKLHVFTANMTTESRHWDFRLKNLINQLIMLLFWGHRHEVLPHSFSILLSLNVDSLPFLHLEIILVFLKLWYFLCFFDKLATMYLNFAFDFVFVDFSILIIDVYSILL